MSEPIKPALTGIEWAGALENTFVRQMMLKESCDPVKGNDHVRAALSLYNQPFGFTREMVTALRELVDSHISDDAGPYGESWKSDELLALIALATQATNNIEALLPAETK